MSETLSDSARRAMASANQEAQRFNHGFIGTEHILLGILRHECNAIKVLRGFHVDPARIRIETEKLVKTGPEKTIKGRRPMTPRAKHVIELAILAARDLNHNYVGTEHLLLGLLGESEGVASLVLQKCGLSIELARSGAQRVEAEEGGDHTKHDGLLLPFEPPSRMTTVGLPFDPMYAYLADPSGKQVSPPMRVELASEIVKRYNAR